MKKKLNVAFIAVFMFILIIPLVFINTKTDQVSAIDNRKLTELTGIEELNMNGLTNAVDNLTDYVGDRVGFRDEMILANQTVGDTVFGVLNHPNYEYGKDGHIFYKLEPEITEYQYYLSTYVDFIKQMQDYCEMRGTGFYYALNPSKNILYEEYLPNGVNYKFADYKALVGYLAERNINYIDLAEPLLKVKNEMGIPVCNTQFDAEHWNANGAFYGISAILEMISHDYPAVSPLNPDDYELGSELQTTLHTSDFPIHEYTPVYTLKTDEQIDISYELAGQLLVNQNFPYYIHIKNPENPDGPKIFIFHGSHIRDEYKPFIADNFSEAIFVYSYFIIADLPYYFNIFQPDIVLYEAADRSIYSLLDMPSLKNTTLPPGVMNFVSARETNAFTIDNTAEFVQSISSGKETLKNVALTVKGTPGYAYMRINDSYLDFTVEKMGNGAVIMLTLDVRRLEGCDTVEIILVSEDGAEKQFVPIELLN